MEQYKTNPWVIVSTILITAILAGGGIFLFENLKTKTEDSSETEETFEIQIESTIQSDQEEDSSATKIDREPQPEADENLTSEQKSAKTNCLTIGGRPYIAYSELYGTDQIFCAFNDGNCTQNELNDDVCYKDTKTASINDIKTAFSKKNSAINYSNYTIEIQENYKNKFIKGTIGAPEGTGAIYWAANINGIWTIVQEAQDSVPCSVFEPYGFPPEIIKNNCY